MHFQLQINLLSSFQFLCQLTFKIFEFISIQTCILWNQIFQIICTIKTVCNRVSTVICAFLISFTDVMDVVFNLQPSVILF